MHDNNARVLSFSCIVEFHFFSLIGNGTGILLINTGKNFHKSGLAGAVLSHKRMYFAAFHFEVNVIQGMNSRKGLINVLHS